MATRGKTTTSAKIGTSRKNGFSRVVLFALPAVICGVALGGYYVFGNRNGAERSDPPVAATGPAVSSDAARLFHPLIGRWRRPDGGYVIDIRGIDAAGKMEAGYFNPRSINVAQAKASLDGEAVKIFIELRDVGYPGATYSLTYNHQQNLLEGLYYQPAAGRAFEVVFVPLR